MGIDPRVYQQLWTPSGALCAVFTHPASHTRPNKDPRTACERRREGGWVRRKGGRVGGRVGGREKGEGIRERGRKEGWMDGWVDGWKDGSKEGKREKGEREDK